MQPCETFLDTAVEMLLQYSSKDHPQKSGVLITKRLKCNASPVVALTETNGGSPRKL